MSVSHLNYQGLVVSRLLTEKPLSQQENEVTGSYPVCCGMICLRGKIRFVQQHYNNGRGIVSEHTPSCPWLIEEDKTRFFHLFCLPPQLEVDLTYRLIHFHRPLADLIEMEKKQPLKEEDIQALVTKVFLCQQQMIKLWSKECPADCETTQILAAAQKEDLKIIHHFSLDTAEFA